MHATLPLLKATDFPALRRKTLETLQINLGYLCNQSCLHCHVNAGPARKELMTRQTINDVLRFTDKQTIKLMDLTGGAPELNPHFRYLITEARKRGIQVMDRCNLTVLFEPGQEGTAEFLAENQVEITASLPCYLEDNVDAQRGKGVFQQSIAALKHLNSLGYGQPDSDLRMNLVYNPQGAVLPPSQQSLEPDYKSHLYKNYGITFNQLFVLANMPIQRFGSTLVSKGMFDEYLRLLKDNHKKENLQNVMCRSMISIDWQGYVYDCDFNQMLDLPIGSTNLTRPHINDLGDVNLEGEAIFVANHCYGCTAGQGSSCGGALA